MFRMHFIPGLIVAVCIGKFIRSGSGTGASFMNMKSVKAEALPCIVRSKAGNISTDAKGCSSMTFPLILLRSSLFFHQTEVLCCI